MARRRALVGMLWAPLTVGLVFAAGLAWYSLVWVPGQRDYFTNRNLRILARLADGLKAKIDNLDNVLEHAAEIRNPGRRAAYFRLQVSNLADAGTRHAADPELQKAAETAGDPPSLEVSADEGTFVLVFRYKDPNDQTAVFVKTRLDSLIAPGQIPDAFDTFIIARARDGQAIYQYSRASSEARLTQLDSLVAAADGKPVVLGSLVKASTVTEITLASTPYVLFSEPLQLSYPEVVKSAAADQRGQPETWVLCGLVSSHRLASTSRAISLTYILWFATALLLLLFSHPFVRIVTAGRTTRLRARDPALLAGSMFVLVMLITLSLLGVYHFNVKPDPEIDGQLVSFAQEVKDHFTAEQTAIWKQLDAFERSALYATASAGVGTRPSLPQISAEQTGVETARASCDPPDACETRILRFATNRRAAGDPTLLDYPYLQSTFWSDEQGSQRVKWAVKGIITPFLDLEKEHLPYYAEARAAWQWGRTNPVARIDPGVPAAPLGRGVSALLSPNTGEPITIFWKLLEWDTEPSVHSHRLVMGALVTKPLSLVQPLVGGDLQFAVIDRRGLVLFHSDPTRNLSENLLSETDGDPRLQALVQSGGGGSLTTNYAGRRHQFYVTPLDVPRVATEPWSLVAFRSLDRREAMHIETFSLASIVFLIYAGVIVVTWAAFRSSAHYPTEWWWPAESHARGYRHVLIANLVLIAGFLAWIEISDGVGLVAGAFIAPLAALAFALYQFGSSRSSDALQTASRPGLAGRAARSGWSQRYLMAMTSLLIVTAVLPTIAFFKISYNFEKRLMIRLTQTQLAGQWRERQARIAADYTNVADHDVVARRVQEDLADRDAYWKHTREVQTTITPGVAAVQVPIGEAGRLAPWIGLIRPPYNDEASQVHALLEPGTWNNFETTSRAGSITDRYASRELAVTIQSTWVPWTLPSDPLWWGGLLLWISLMFGWMRSVSGKVFFVDVAPGRPDPTTWTLDQAEHVLIVGPPLSGKTARVRALAGVHTIDLRNLTRRQRRDAVASPAAPTPAGQSAASVADTIDFHGLPADLDIPVVLDHFEHRMTEEWWLRQRLELLEQLVFRYRRKIAVVSSVDPLDCLDRGDKTTEPSVEAQQQRAALEMRWAALLSSFERRGHGFAATKPAQSTLDLLEGKLANHPALARMRLIETFTRECTLLPQLQSIGVDIVDELSSDDGLTAEQLLDEVASRAEPCYRAIWTACSTDEKLALVQLAQEGIVNPQNSLVIRRLAAKGLVIGHPRPRVVTDGLARFVATAAAPSTVATWESRDQGIPWNTVLWMTVLSASAFLFVSQQEVAKAWLAYLTGASAAIPALLKLPALLRSPGSEQKA